MTMFKKSLAALAATAALAAAPTSAMAAGASVNLPNCLGLTANNAAIDACYGFARAGRTGQTFNNWNVGSLSLGGLSDLVGTALTYGINLSSVSLFQGGHSVASDNTVGNGISFNDIAAGNYQVRISGSLTSQSLLGVRGGAVAFNIIPAIPEPETYALMIAGLLAMGFVARRRNQG